MMVFRGVKLGVQERSFQAASCVCTVGALCVGVQWGACGEMHLCALLPSVKVAEGQDLCAPFQDVSTFFFNFIFLAKTVSCLVQAR